MFIKKGTSSSAIREIGYNATRKILRIHFRWEDPTQVYEYAGVETWVFENFPVGSGGGLFFTKNVRGKYAYRKIPADMFQDE